MNEMLQEVIEKMDRESPFFKIYYAKENKMDPLGLVNKFLKEEREEKALDFLQTFLPSRLDRVEKEKALAVMYFAIRIISVNSKALCVENLAYVIDLENFIKESKDFIEKTEKSGVSEDNEHFAFADKLKSYLYFYGYLSHKDVSTRFNFAQGIHSLAISQWRELFSLLKTKNETWI